MWLGRQSLANKSKAGWDICPGYRFMDRVVRCRLHTLRQDIFYVNTSKQGNCVTVGCREGEGTLFIRLRSLHMPLVVAVYSRRLFRSTLSASLGSQITCAPYGASGDPTQVSIKTPSHSTLTSHSLDQGTSKAIEPLKRQLVLDRKRKMARL